MSSLHETSGDVPSAAVDKWLSCNRRNFSFPLTDNQVENPHLVENENVDVGEGLVEIYGKKKHRRRASRKKRRFRPYIEMTWEERKRLDERARARAARILEEKMAKGLPVAPHNSNEFLMEEHDLARPDLKIDLNPKRSLSQVDYTSGEGEDTESDSISGDESGFLQKDFYETYERLHAEGLENMSKEDLIREYLEMEKYLHQLQEENRNLSRQLKMQAQPEPAVLEKVDEEE